MSSTPYHVIEGPAGCTLWLIDLTQAPSETAWLACSEAEHAQAARFHFPQHAQRYKAAHAGMRQLLAEHLHAPMASVTWTVGENGKPRLDGHPGCHFNLSHSEDWALLGLSDGAPIGVDIEWCHDMRDMAGMVRRMYSPLEQAAFARLPAAAQRDWFFRVWSRKEACIKALGSGLSASTRSFEVGGEPVALETAVPYAGLLCHMTVHSLSLNLPAMAAVALVRNDCHRLAQTF